MSNKNSFDYYSLWGELNNENFNFVESHRIKIDEVGYNRFTMTPNRWKRDFNAIGIIPSTSSGKYSKGTFAHTDIAFEFTSWLSHEFKLYLIKEFERLKTNSGIQLADLDVNIFYNYYKNIMFFPKKSKKYKFWKNISKTIDNNKKIVYNIYRGETYEYYKKNRIFRRTYKMER